MNAEKQKLIRDIQINGGVTVLAYLLYEFAFRSKIEIVEIVSIFLIIPAVVYCVHKFFSSSIKLMHLSFGIRSPILFTTAVAIVSAIIYFGFYYYLISGDGEPDWTALSSIMIAGGPITILVLAVCFGYTIDLDYRAPAASRYFNAVVISFFFSYFMVGFGDDSAASYKDGTATLWYLLIVGAMYLGATASILYTYIQQRRHLSI